MAKEIGAVGVGGKGNAKAPAAPRGRGATQARAAGEAADKPRAEKAGEQQGQGQVEGVELSDDARAQLKADDPQAKEAKDGKEAEDELLRETTDQLEQKAKELEAELARPKKERNQDKVKQLLGDVQDLQARFDNLTGVGARNPIGNAARNTAPAGGRVPAGGGAPIGGRVPPLLGNPYGGGVQRGGGGGLPGGQIPAQPANPNVQIPNFGPNASKAQIGQMLDAAAQKHGIPANILKSVAWQESRWNSKALSFDGQHGKGVMQIDDRFHTFARTKDVFDPTKNIDYGARFLADLYKKTGSWSGALKRYNGGSAYPPKILAHARNQPWARNV